MQYALQFFIFNFQFQKTLLNYRGQSLLTVDCCPLTFFWAFRLSPSGFPLYLFPLTLQKDAAPIPNALAAAEKKVKVLIDNSNFVNIIFIKFARNQYLLISRVILWQSSNQRQRA